METRQEQKPSAQQKLNFWQTVYLLADSWVREINYNDVMKKNYDALYKRTGMHGTSWAYGSGAMYAIAFRIIRAIILFIIPQGYLRLIATSYTTYQIATRCIRIDRGLKSFHTSNTWNTLCLGFWTAWLFICVIFFSPQNQWLADYAVRRCILGLPAAFIQYAKQDDSMQWNIIHWQAQLQSIGAYTLTSYLMYSDTGFARVRQLVFWYMNYSFYWSLLAADTRFIALCWVILERTCSYFDQRYWLESATFLTFTIGPIIYSFYRFSIDSGVLPRPKHRIPQRIKIFLVKQTYILDRLDFLEAFLLYLTPTFLIRVAHATYQTKQVDLLNEEEKAKVYKRWTGKHVPLGENPQEIPVEDYEYLPLAQDEIRLLIIGPMTSIFQDIPLQIEHHKLAEAGEYEALSYCWGDQELSEEIKISGKRIPITLSALDLIIARCALGKKRRVWIDAVCINQKDQQEKASQVALMYSIYSQASRVILFPIAESAARSAAGLLYEAKIAPNTFVFNNDLHLRGLLTNTVLDLRKTTMRWRALANLLTNVYFSRAWIMQEIVAAKNPELYLGGFYMPWSDFVTAVGRLSIVEYQHSLLAIRFGKNVPKDYIGLRNNAIIMLNALRMEEPPNDQVYGSGYLRRLDNLLDIAAEFNSTDPRDKIYALTEISNDSFVQPDYTRDYLDVLKDATKGILQDQRINILAMAGMGYPGAHTISWLPDLARKRPPPLTIPHLTKPRYQPSTTPARISIEADTITVTGFMVDAIHEISEVCFDQTSSLLTAETQLAFHKAAFELAAKYGKADKEITLTLVAEKEVTTTFQNDQIQDLQWPDDQSKRYAEYLEAEIKAGDQTFDELSFLARQFRGYTRSIQQACDGRRFGITIHGRLCLVPELSNPGDIICILDGAQVPYVLRSAGDENVCQLVGEAYVHGIMHGEAISDSRSSFVLI